MNYDSLMKNTGCVQCIWNNTALSNHSIMRIRIPSQKTNEKLATSIPKLLFCIIRVVTTPQPTALDPTHGAPFGMVQLSTSPIHCVEILENHTKFFWSNSQICFDPTHTHTLLGMVHRSTFPIPSSVFSTVLWHIAKRHAFWVLTNCDAVYYVQQDWFQLLNLKSFSLLMLWRS